MAQHFLQSSAARTLSLTKVMRMTEDEAYELFLRLRWPENDGEPVCPECGCDRAYRITTRKRFKCAACYKQFSVTSGSIFSSRKLAIRDILAAIAIFVNGVKGVPALQMSRELGVHHTTAFVLAHKLREAIGSDIDESPLAGEVEVDGAYFGGHVKPKNRKVDRVDRRKAENKTGKRQVVTVVREREGRAITFVDSSESAATASVASSLAEDVVLYADEAPAWDVLHSYSDAKRINHKERYADGPISTNWAESYFSRLRRSEIGIHHHIAGPYLQAYADEMAWRENNRRLSNGAQFEKVVGAALAHPVSRKWKGYWQRRANPNS